MVRTIRIVDALYMLAETRDSVENTNPEWKNIKVFDKSILPALETNLGNNTSGADYFAETSGARMMRLSLISQHLVPGEYRAGVFILKNPNQIERW